MRLIIWAVTFCEMTMNDNNVINENFIVVH